MNRRLRPAIAVAMLLAATTVALGQAPASAGPQPRRAVCQSRACLVVLETFRDRDGDGVADVDEKLVGTAADDPTSTPEASLLIDLLLKRRLTSFERHFTELVLLPTLTPDGSAIATGLGEFQLVDHDANLLASAGIVLGSLDVNGFDLQFGLKVTGSRQPPTYGITPGTMSGTTFLSKYDRSLYSDYTNGGLAQFGANAGKEVHFEILGDLDGKPYIDYERGVRDYTEVYVDGSRDEVHDSFHSTEGDKATSTTITSYDKSGQQTSEVYRYQRESTQADGSTVTELHSTQPIKENGKIVGTRDVYVKIVEKDGKGTLTKEETIRNKDGEVVERTKTDGDCDAECVEKEKKAHEEGEFSDPDYIGFDIVTEQDMARLEFRIKWISTPAPDDGNTGGPAPAPPSSGQCWPNCGGDGLLVLMDPDAVVVVAAGSEPRFNRRVQPDYDPWLQELTGMTGQPVPVTGGGQDPPRR
ncbi:hypothetical protein [Asanoa iriomotensis]|uniref:YD repeat-containing protein n=1 Tax=Asanoa iriomotensis TaxID=234613 RepID=A0ABQ4BYY9_9ACTN|nr:hypothetical protein [Asanoa iriomotensis]GIF55746.1 hypothetical protein Air01nite_18410 [Asanoa iriomotensis]